MTYICVIEAEVKLSFYFYNIRDDVRIEGMFKVLNFLAMGAVFGTNSISDVFKIVPRVDDKR